MTGPEIPFCNRRQTPWSSPFVKKTFQVLFAGQDLWIADHRSLFQINRYFLNFAGEFEWHLIVLTDGCAGVFADVKSFIE